jgi:hypothetical protein
MTKNKHKTREATENRVSQKTQIMELSMKLSNNYA